MLHNLGCGVTEGSSHEQCALLHTPGHVTPSLLHEGVVGEGPGAGGGAELLTAGLSFSITIISLIVAATGEEAGLGVAAPAQHQPGQPAGGGVRGEEHLDGVLVSSVTVISREEDGCNHIMKDT